MDSTGFSVLGLIGLILRGLSPWAFLPRGPGEEFTSMLIEVVGGIHFLPFSCRTEVSVFLLALSWGLHSAGGCTLDSSPSVCTAVIIWQDLLCLDFLTSSPAISQRSPPLTLRAPEAGSFLLYFELNCAI